jgi:putative tryptophan/tyrosine transport system substrate-binding protein
MKRREFIAGLGSAAAWPLAARGQQRQVIPVIGVVLDGGWTPQQRAAFARGLAETGYIEGRNVAIDSRLVTDGRLREVTEDLVRQRVSMIATPGSTPAALAAKAATATISIVFGVGFDPVQLGLVASFNRPGGNLTGYTEMQDDVVSKRLELLQMLAPAAAQYGALVDLRNPFSEQMANKARKTAEFIGKPLEVISVSDDAALEAVFRNLPHNRIDAMLFSPGPFFYTRRNQVIQLTANHGIPAAYWLREFPATGGLMSYGSSIDEMFHQVGNYSGRVLHGAKPADLPVARATKFELVINARAAKALGLPIPQSLLTIADDVID